MLQGLSQLQINAEASCWASLWGSMENESRTRTRRRHPHVITENLMAKPSFVCWLIKSSAISLHELTNFMGDTGFEPVTPSV